MFLVLVERRNATVGCRRNAAGVDCSSWFGPEEQRQEKNALLGVFCLCMCAASSFGFFFLCLGAFGAARSCEAQLHRFLGLLVLSSVADTVIIFNSD